MGSVHFGCIFFRCVPFLGHASHLGHLILDLAILVVLSVLVSFAVDTGNRSGARAVSFLWDSLVLWPLGYLAAYSLSSGAGHGLRDMTNVVTVLAVVSDGNGGSVNSVGTGGCQSDAEEAGDKKHRMEEHSKLQR